MYTVLDIHISARLFLSFPLIVTEDEQKKYTQAATMKKKGKKGKILPISLHTTIDFYPPLKIRAMFLHVYIISMYVCVPFGSTTAERIQTSKKIMLKR